MSSTLSVIGRGSGNSSGRGSRHGSHRDTGPTHEEEKVDHEVADVLEVEEAEEVVKVDHKKM